jgi:hypothetical protein
VDLKSWNLKALQASKPSPFIFTNSIFLQHFPVLHPILKQASSQYLLKLFPFPSRPLFRTQKNDKNCLNNYFHPLNNSIHHSETMPHHFYLCTGHLYPVIIFAFSGPCSILQFSQSILSFPIPYFLFFYSSSVYYSTLFRMHNFFHSRQHDLAERVSPILWHCASWSDRSRPFFLCSKLHPRQPQKQALTIIRQVKFALEHKKREER